MHVLPFRRLCLRLELDVYQKTLASCFALAINIDVVAYLLVTLAGTWKQGHQKTLEGRPPLAPWLPSINTLLFSSADFEFSPCGFSCSCAHSAVAVFCAVLLYYLIFCCLVDPSALRMLSSD